MKLRKKVITLSLAVMAALSASLSITANAAPPTTSNHSDTYKTVTMYPQSAVCQSPTPWRKKLNSTSVYLKIYGLSYNRKVNVMCQGASSSQGLYIPNDQWSQSKLQYAGTLNYGVSVFNTRWWTLGNGEYFLANYIYETGYYAKPARIFFENYDMNDYSFNIAWSPDSV